jgi:serine/threonine protein kinase
MRPSPLDGPATAPFPCADQKTIPLNPRRVQTEAAIRLLEVSEETLFLGHFRLQETVGRGGFGEVYRAFDEKLHRTVAVKLMQPHLAIDPLARAQFIREARAAAAVRHENVVQIYSVEDAKLPYIVMEYVSGGSLQSYLSSRGPLGVTEVLRIGAQIARGLAAAHEHGLVHRDIKPGNILIDWAEGIPRAKLTDFGLAHRGDDTRLVKSGLVLGTPAYMSPEQAQGKAINHRSDLYSFGTVLYEMASGCTLYEGENTLALLKVVGEGRPQPLRQVSPETPVWLSSIIDKLLSLHPDDRFGSAREVAELLEKYLADFEKQGEVKLPREKKPHRRSRSSGLTAAALVIGISLAAAFANRGNWSSPIPLPEPATAQASPAPRLTNYTNALGMEFAQIPAGTSRLGAPFSVRPVKVSLNYYLGAYEVTREEWERVLGPNSCPTKVPDGISAEHAKRWPVTGVSWKQCQVFLRELNRQAPERGWLYRLPQIGEWEYACRGGPNRSDAELNCSYYAGEPSEEAHPERMNSSESERGLPTRVGSFPPNRLGLYDMHGNAFELLGTVERDNCYLAGGCWIDDTTQMRATPTNLVNRDHGMVGSGFRIARVPSDTLDMTTECANPVLEAILQLNPQFKGNVGVDRANGFIHKVEITLSEGLTDLTPFAHFRHLKILSIPGEGVRDLTPLIGLQLESLFVWGFDGVDLTPIKGMPLRELNCGGGGKRIDLTPLKGMPLQFLCLNCTQVDDLTPLSDLPIDLLMIGPSSVRDLSPLSKMQTLKCLHMGGGTPITNLFPVAHLSLEKLSFDYDPSRDSKILLTISTLKEINSLPASEWWGAAKR